MLQTQIRFRQLVLKQQYPDKSIFCFSVARKKLHSDQLASNLILLIESTPVLTHDDLKAPDQLIGQRIRHRFINEDGISSWYHGVVVGAPKPEVLQVLYFGEEEICEFTNLLQDFSDGDLELDSS